MNVVSAPEYAEVAVKVSKGHFKRWLNGELDTHETYSFMAFLGQQATRLWLEKGIEILGPIDIASYDYTEHEAVLSLFAVQRPS